MSSMTWLLKRLQLPLSELPPHANHGRHLGILQPYAPALVHVSFLSQMPYTFSEAHKL